MPMKNALNVAADVAGTTVEILTSGYRLGTYCMMRQIVAYWLHKEKGYSKRDIAVAINRDRSTIYHAVNRIDSLLEIGDRLTTDLWNLFSTTINLNDHNFGKDKKNDYLINPNKFQYYGKKQMEG